MKKIIMRSLIAAAIAFSASTSANAQLSNVLGNALSKVSSSSSNSTLSTIAGVITSKLVPTSSQIVGTWAYQEPAIMFTSSNVLKSTAASVVTKSVETKLQSYLTKLGITKGNLTITFDADKNFNIKLKNKQVASGTYTISSNDVTLTFKGRSQPCKVTPQLDNGTLVIVMDATKLKTFFQNIGSNVSYLSTITSLLKQVDGMKVGLRLSKQ